MPQGIEFSKSGPGVRISSEDAPRMDVAKGEIVFGTNFVYDSKGAIAPITGTREPFKPEQTNWNRVLDMISKNPSMDINAAKRASVMSR